MRHPIQTITPLILLCLVTLLYPLSVLADSLSVSAVVPANATSFSAILTSDTTGTVGQNKTITYTLTYGSTLSTDSTVTLEASWTRGTIQGSGSQVDVLSYVPGSATNAYGNTPAVIDSVNQKITWNILTLSPNVTGQQVIFKLKTSSSLTSSPIVTFNVSGDLNGPGFTTTPSIVTGSFSTNSTTSPTNTPAPTPTPTSSPAVITPTPTEVIKPPLPSVGLSEVTIRTITTTDALIAIRATSPTAIKIGYGESLDKMNTIISDPQSLQTHLVLLPNLKPATTYFFTVYYGSQQSDIYTFATALPGDVPAPLLPSLVVTSGNTVLTTPLQKNVTSSSVDGLMLPTATFYEFRISIPNASTIKRVQAILRNGRILSATPSETDEITSLDLIQISPGIFTGKLLTPTQPGNYLLFLRISDTRGNIVEQKITTIRITQPFTVLNEKGKPIESARIKLWYYDYMKSKFLFLDPRSTSIPNPSFSGINGVVGIILPQGKYRAEVSDLKYETKTVEFSVGNSGNDSYPSVVLKTSPFNLMNIFSYYFTTLHEQLFQQTQTYISSLSMSHRMLDLVSLIIMSSFIVLLLLSFISRIQISLLMLPRYLLYLFRRTFSNSRNTHFIVGKVVDAQTNKWLGNVTLYARNETDRIISHAITDKTGSFRLTNLTERSYNLSFVKTGYRPFILTSLSPQLLTHELKIGLSTKARPNDFMQIIQTALFHLLDVCFEIILLLSLILIITVGVSLGWNEVLPYLSLAIVNLITWILHQQYQPIKTI